MTPEEIQAQRNQQLAQRVASGTLSAGRQQPQGPERTPAQNREVFTGHEQELSDEEVAQRMGEGPPETFEGIVQRMAQNYQTSPQYQQLLDQELEQISSQIAQLTQRRNMIEMAKRGQG